MKCDRNGCESAATQQVRHTGYSPESPVTFACNQHAAWWIYGVHGLKIGRLSPVWDRWAR